MTDTVAETLVPHEGYTEDMKHDGSKTFSCKQCDKQSNCEKGIKNHITSVHKRQAMKRTTARNDNAKNEETKKTRFTSIMEEPDVADFEFDPLAMETSSQIGGDEHLDNTTDICAEFLKDKSDQNKEFDGLDNTVENIVQARAKCNADLINLEESISPDQDHNYIKEDSNDNTVTKDVNEEETMSLRAEVLSLNIDMRGKDNEISRLLEENTKLKDELKTKDEANDAITAENNSLEESKRVLDAKINALTETKSKYESRLKTYGATIRQMDAELKQSKAPKAKSGKEVSDKEFIVLNNKVNKENKELHDKLQKTTKQLNDKQKELKETQATSKKKVSAEKELQQYINEKNGKISELEITNTRLQMMYDHSKEIGNKPPNAKDKKDEDKSAKPSDPTEKVTSEPKVKTKCFYENNSTCRDHERCKFLHPKKTCQSFSKLGSCSQESLCEHRHPQNICFRLQSTGYCASGDRCRNRHPLEYAYKDYSQSNYNKQNYNNNLNYNFLGSSPHSLQGPGGSEQRTGTRNHGLLLSIPE